MLSQLSCTSSPFGQNEISEGRREMTGSVLLSEPRNLEDIYVWMEEFNISSRTDENGEFSLTLPPPSSQSQGGGVNGVFDLYFYIANYYLRKTEVLVRDGEFLYGEASLNADGELLAPEVLTEFLLIRTTITPTITTLDCSPNPPGPSTPPCDTMLVRLTLQATKGDSVPVVFPGSPSGLGGVVLKNVDTEEAFTIAAIPGSQSQHTVGVEEQPVTRVMTFNLRENPIPRGTYEVIPYFLIRFEDIPQGLKASLGPAAEQLDVAFLRIPFRRQQAATLTIL